jgi:hypothetical protein
MFIHEIAYRLKLVQKRVTEGCTVDEALAEIEDANTREAAAWWLAAAAERLPKGSTHAVVVRDARLEVLERSRY